MFTTKCIISCLKLWMLKGDKKKTSTNRTVIKDNWRTSKRSMGCRKDAGKKKCQLLLLIAEEEVAKKISFRPTGSRSTPPSFVLFENIRWEFNIKFFIQQVATIFCSGFFLGRVGAYSVKFKSVSDQKCCYRITFEFERKKFNNISPHEIMSMKLLMIK